MRLFSKTRKDVASDKKGLAAVEFALIAPVLIVFYFGCVEVSMMLTTDRKVTNVASAVADLVAQDDIIDTGEMNDIFSASKAIMIPGDASGLQIRVTSVMMDTDGDTEVRWSKASNHTPRSCGSAVTVPSGLLSPGQSIVMAEVSYGYTPPVGEFLTGTFTLKDTFYLRPRRSVEVAFDPPPC